MKVTAKIGRHACEQSALLRRLREEGYDSGIDLPFSCEELSCWVRKEAAPMMAPEELVSAIKVAHFLEADAHPWAACLADFLFSPSWAQQKGAWQLLDGLSALHGAVGTVLQASGLHTADCLQRMPAEWKLPFFDGLVHDGHLDVDESVTADLCSVAHRLAAVRSAYVKAQADWTDNTSALWHALARFPSLRDVDVDSPNLARHGFIQKLRPDCGLALALSIQTALTRVRLTADNLTSGSFGELARVLTPLRGLRDVEVRHCANGHSPDDTEALAYVLPELTCLTRLALGVDELYMSDQVHSDIDAPQRLHASLAACTALRHLELMFRGLSWAHADGLAAVLTCMTRLTCVVFDRCALIAPQLPALCAAFPALPNLRSLHISANTLSLSDIDLTAEHLSKLSHLRSLRLAGDDAAGSCGLQYNAHAAFAAPLRTMTALTSLAVHRGPRTSNPVSAAMYCHTVSCLRELRSLDLSGDDVARDGATIGAALASLQHLSHLSLRATSACAAGGATALAAGIAAATALQHLDVGCNPHLCDGFATAFAPQLSALTALSELHVDSLNGLTGAGRAALMQHAIQLPQLRRMSVLDSHACTVDAVLPLLPHLRAAPQRIHFSGFRGEGDASTWHGWSLVSAALESRDGFGCDAAGSM